MRRFVKTAFPPALLAALLPAMPAMPAPAGAGAQSACSVKSPPHTVAVAELYTSEGCSSCPPADRWLASVSRDSNHATQVVALGFHVDYWDYIGWKDEFATPAYTQRQRDWSQAHRSRFVYTPQIVFAGSDYRGWDGSGFAADVKRINARLARADLNLSAMPTKNVIAVNGSARIANPADRPGAQAYLALTQSGLATPVKRGENKGVTLRHDNVVREWHGPLSVAADGSLAMEKRLVIPKDAKPADLRVVLLVQRGGEILQAVALPLGQPACQG